MPVIDGTNGDERRLFVGLYQLAGSTVTAANYESTLASRFAITPAAAAVVALHYPLSAYPSAPLAYAAAWTDESFSCPALTLDQSLSKYVATYAYEFNDQNAPERYLAPVGFPYGAAHESEVQYLFSLSNTAFPGTLSSAQVKLASTMKTSWTNFAKGANPSSPGGAHWSRFTPTGEQMWSLDTPPQGGDDLRHRAPVRILEPAELALQGATAPPTGHSVPPTGLIDPPVLRSPCGAG